MDNMPEMPIVADPSPTPPPPPPQPLAHPHPHRLPFRIIIIILALGAAAAYYLYPQLSRIFPHLGSADLPGLSTLVSPAPKSSYDPVVGADNKLVYLRQPDPNTPASYEAWLIDPRTGEEEKLPLSGFTQAYKYYGSTQLFYRPLGEEAEYRVLDLATGAEQSYKLIAHPDPSAHESANMDNLRMISPDGKWLVFQVDFFKPCPSPSPFPSGFQGGFGPCQPDESLDTPYGYYLYDVDNRSATYLGDLIRVSRWDTANQKLYYVQDSSTKLLDLATKSTTHVDASSYFGYFTYPLLASNQLVCQEGATGNTGESAFSQISLIDLDTRKKEEIDKVDDWAAIQPFLTASPDDQNIVYVRTNQLPSSIRRSDLFNYNLSTKKITRLTPEDSQTSYRYYGEWIDNHTYVTGVDTIEETGYNNTNNYLVTIDVETGVVTRLTPHTMVYSYASQ